MQNSNYSSINTIKAFAQNELIEKYFGSDVATTNSGLIGYTTEILGNATEDSFNTLTSFLNEFFPHTAQLPETVYNYASMYSLEEILATSAKIYVLLLVSEEDILEYAKRIEGSAEIYEFFLDSNMKIFLQDMEFSPDYDIRITYRPYKGDLIFSANYSMKKHNASYTNMTSDITNPYIKLKRIYMEGKRYVLLQVQCHQVEKHTMNEIVLSNNILISPSYRIDYEGMLDNIEVFYKAPEKNNYQQLVRRIENSFPIQKPFFYYRQVDKTVNGGTIEIFFSMIDKYFQPEVNSELIIHYDTTKGEKGNFAKYLGELTIGVTTDGSVYDYNSNISLFCHIISGSSGGKDTSDFETVRHDASIAMSTLKSYTTENDMMLYFSKFNRNNKTTSIIPIKKRDDIGTRLFTSFSYFRNKKRDIVHTNTLNIVLNKSDFDSVNTQSNTHILKPNHLYKYDGAKLGTCKITSDKINTHPPYPANEFVYACPYTILFVSNPTSVGYFLLTVNEDKIVDYEYINELSPSQFICAGFHIQRNSVSDDFYEVTVSLSPVSKLHIPIVKVDPNTGVETKQNSVIVRLGVMLGTSTIGEIDCKLDSYDLAKEIYTFKAKIITDDTITVNDNIRVTNLVTESSGVFNTNPRMIPMANAVVSVNTYYCENEADIVPTLVDGQLANVSKYTKTNTYTTDTNRVNFVYPINSSRSDCIYNDLGGGNFEITISDVPLVEYKVLEDINYFWEFNEYIYNAFKYIEEIKMFKTNNYGMDMKFYNTFGRGKNFTIGDDSNRLLDRVNIKLHFEVKPIFGTDNEDLIRDLREYIKSFIENINVASNGSNAIYISNLIQAIENTFPSVNYLKFKSINEYPSDIQVIENNIVDLTTLDKQTRIHYVPEYLTIESENIVIDII